MKRNNGIILLLRMDQLTEFHPRTPTSSTEDDDLSGDEYWTVYYNDYNRRPPVSVLLEWANKYHQTHGGTRPMDIKYRNKVERHLVRASWDLVRLRGHRADDTLEFFSKFIGPHCHWQWSRTLFKVRTLLERRGLMRCDCRYVILCDNRVGVFRLGALIAVIADGVLESAHTGVPPLSLKHEFRAWNEIAKSQ